MDSNTSLPPPDQYRSLVKRLQSSAYLLNKQLQHICLVNGLRTSGVKADLQRRILDGKLACPFTLSQHVTTASLGWLSLITFGIALCCDEAARGDGLSIFQTRS